MNGLEPISHVHCVLGFIMVFYFLLQLALLPAQISSGNGFYSYKHLLGFFPCKLEQAKEILLGLKSSVDSTTKGPSDSSKYLYRIRARTIIRCRWYNKTTCQYLLYSIRCRWYNKTTCQYHLYSIRCRWYNKTTCPYHLYSIRCRWYNKTTCRYHLYKIESRD